MNSRKKIDVDFASIAGLKAELLRKQTEVKVLKAKQDTQPKPPATAKVKTKKQKDTKPKVEPRYTEIEDVETLKKSKRMLEAKTMLYDKLKKTGGDTNRTYLVDFSNKSDESDDEIHKEDDYQDTNSDPEEDWVDYTDCFGRTKKCLRKDLAKMREKDNFLKREITKEPEPPEIPEQTPEPVPFVPDKDPAHEIMRKKWEEQMERLADKTDIHYQDVLFDEARAHGVGYYAFSQNEEERAKEQANLAKLRKETEQRQKEMQEVRDLRSKMDFNRLKAATVRQRIRAGLSAELTEEEEEALRTQIQLRYATPTQDSKKNEDNEEVDKARNKSRIDNSLIVVEDKIKAFGELLGKRPRYHEMSQEEWVHKRRKDRLGEFAPVYENFRRSEYLKGTRDNQITTKDEDEDDPVRINASGPEPTDVWETARPVYSHEDIKEDKVTVVNTTINNKPETVEVSEDSDDPEIIGPLPPQNYEAPSFINSFVPQPMATGPTLPVSFVRSVPPPQIVNFSVPPPTMMPPLYIPPPSMITSFSIPPPSMVPPVSIPINPTHSEIVVEASSDTSDSDDYDIIGPVPPPSVMDFEKTTRQTCGPNLIDENHINRLSDIPLPASVAFNTSSGVSNLAQTREIEGSRLLNDSISSNLNASTISAGLKYLRQKFDKIQDS